MTVRSIITAPDPRLKTVSDPVGTVTNDIRALMDDMLETMYDAPGIGLAAIQIGVPKRIIVMDLAKEDEPKEPRFFVNPEVVWVSDDLAIYEEGCLSVPELYEDVERPAQCLVKFLDYDGNPQDIECDEMLATCIQHEIDHLQGILFIDHISRLKRAIILKKLIKAQRQKEPA